MSARRIPKPSGEFIQVDGYDLHCVMAGEGPPCVYVHGSHGSTNDLTHSPFFDMAKREFRLIAFDRPGFGHSRRGRGDRINPVGHAEILEGLISTLGLEQPILIGHSWGAAVVLGHALHHVGGVRGLLLLGPAAYSAGRLGTAWYWPLLRVPGLSSVLRRMALRVAGRRLSRGLWKRAFGSHPLPQGYVKAATSMAIRYAQFDAELRDDRRIKTNLNEMSRRYADIRLPVRIVNGEDDPITTVEFDAQPLQDALPSASLRVVPGAGHMLHFSHPQIVLDELRQLVRSE